MKPGRLALVCALALPLAADEGMWLFNRFPTDTVKQKYNFEVTARFLENLRLASLRIGGGSGSFVSPDGLIFTNHHVAGDCIAKLGSARHDYMRDGFAAPSPSGELPCPDLEADVLVAMEDVSQAVKDAGAAAARPADAVAKRGAAIAAIEKACREKTGNSCSVVKLFAGERYDLYQYRRYTDIRLVFAPEFAIAFFGGDPDNFTYPRYDLDIAFLRAYENGRPAATPHFLKWSPEGVKENDLVFVAGNPGATSRLATQAQFDFYRTVQLPLTLSRLMTRIEALRAYGAESAENKRAARRVLFELANSYKSSAGKLLGLRDDRLMLRKKQFEKRLRRAVEQDRKLGAEAAKVWDDVAAAYRAWTPGEKPYAVLERPAARGSTLFRLARILVRLGEERAKPDGQRLPEFRDSAMPSLALSIESPAPVDAGTEIAMLAVYLDELKALGEKEAPVKSLLAGRTSQAAAEAMVKGSRLADPAERKRLAADPAAAAGSDDPLMRLARALDPAARKLRGKYENTIGQLDAGALERIAQYRFKVLGPNEYPDATFTPRVSFGAVKGYRDKTEAPVPYATTFGGMYHRAGAEEPYILPDRWVAARSRLDLVVPFDFVSTCDITGGNSGSPAVNTKGELVGIVFDGNIESLPLTYMYGDERARAVHVASQGIVEALGKVYHAEWLLRQLGVAASAATTRP